MSTLLVHPGKQGAQEREWARLIPGEQPRHKFRKKPPQSVTPFALHEVHPPVDDKDLVVLTSRSEGIPLVLMEAMARGKIVLAPSITGIPELVISGKTGFLYQPGSLENFVESVLLIQSLILAENRCAQDASIHPDGRLDWIRHAARAHVQHNFNRNRNLKQFADSFLRRVVPNHESAADENLVLQQI